MSARVTMAARLARWLGPWMPETARPRDVSRTQVRVEGRFDAWVYRPSARAPSGALLLVPGLHYLGPADPRLDRFLAVLADAGILVLAPFLPELRELRVGPSLVPDTVASYEALLALPDRPAGRPGVFSISFGNYPAIHLAAQRDVGALVLFGGYADFEDVIRFSLEEASEVPQDPLNRPVVFLALLEHLPGLPRDPEALRRAWLTFVRRTWGRLDMKQGGYRGVAREMARHVADDARALFLIGTGATPGGDDLVREALARGRGTLAHLDVLDAAPAVRCPTTVVHGTSDDVIPHTHARQLADAIPDARLLLTGLYAHTGAGMIDPRAALDEGRAMLGILGAIVDAATR